MIYDLCDADSIDDKLRRTLDQKVTGMESRGFEVYMGLQQRDAIIALGDLLGRAEQLFGPDIIRARSDMSAVKLPMGMSLDSRMGRLEKGLSVDTDEEFLDLIYMVARAFGEAAASAPSWIWLNRDSNIGYPDYSPSTVKRIENFTFGLHCYHTGEALPCQAFGGIRKSPDSTQLDASGTRIAKRRDFAYTKEIWEKVASYFVDSSNLQLREEQGVVFGKTPVWDDAPFTSAARVRSVKGLSYIDNSFPMVLRQTICDPGQVSPFVWKHRGITDVLMKTKGRFVFCTDFSNFDQTVTADEIDAIKRAFRDNWPDLVGPIDQMFHMMEHLEFTQADLLRPPLSEHRTTLYYKSICEPGSILGIISGLGITDVIGKIIGTAFSFYVHRKLGAKINTFSEGEKLQLNCGDDLAILTESKKDDEILKIIDTQRFKSVRQESEKKFLGHIFLTDSEGKVTDYIPSYVSFFVNSLCPERQAGTGMRPYAEYGLQQRYQILRPHVKTDEQAAIIDEFYARLCGLIPDFDALVEEQIAEINKPGDFQEFMNKYGLTKIEEIYYRLSIKDLPKEDAELIGILVPSQEIIKQLPEIAPYMGA